MIKGMISILLLCLASCGREEISYSAFLEGQVQKWNRLSPLHLERLSPHFEFDLDTVRYTENIETVSGFVITIDNRIYFPGKVNPHKFSVLAHELEHVAQYKENPALFNEYYYAESIVSFGQTISSGKLSIREIHDNIELEQQAKEKAEKVMRSMNSTKWLQD